MKLRQISIVFGLLIGMALAGCLPSTPQPTPTTVPTTSEALTAAAWNALEKQPAVAIDNAKKCIDLFETTATEQQAKLTSAPPDGAVSEDQKKAIFANWALNDVGTSYWIMGQALEKLNRANDAKEAYKGAQKFPYARTWDSQGWFWQPAKAASERLAKMP